MQNKEMRGARRRDYILERLSLISAAVAMTLFLIILIIPLISWEGLGAADAQVDAPGARDDMSPVINGARNITVYRGESVAYRKNITVSDDGGDENVTLTVDSSRVNISKPGTYAVTYTATDRAGNKTAVSIFVTVLEHQISPEILNAALDRVIAQIITDGMNNERKLRAVYDYVRGHIAYVSDSDKSDWRAEAYRALFETGTGDCYSYFAAAKAFFERLGIDNLDIQRTPNLVEETHFWSLVNISDDSAVKSWYHFDATRLRSDEFNHSGCLLTERQINAYSKIREHFYTYNKSSYPSASTKIITPTPELEPYLD